MGLRQHNLRILADVPLDTICHLSSGGSRELEIFCALNNSFPPTRTRAAEIVRTCFPVRHSLKGLRQDVLCSHRSAGNCLAQRVQQTCYFSFVTQRVKIKCPFVQHPCKCHAASGIPLARPYVHSKLPASATLPTSCSSQPLQ